MVMVATPTSNVNISEPHESRSLGRSAVRSLLVRREQRAVSIYVIEVRAQPTYPEELSHVPGIVCQPLGRIAR